MTDERRTADGAFRLMRTLRRLRQRVPVEGEAESERLEDIFHRWARLRAPALELAVREHDPRWAEVFARERDRIRAALGDAVVDIQHIGSTAIPPLPGKDVVDLAVAVRAVPGGRGAAPEAAEAALAALGYASYGPSPIHPDLTWLWQIAADRQSALVVHLGDHASPQFHYVASFRDFLCALPAERARYEELKRELAAVPGQSWLEYSVCKGVLVWRIGQRASAWARARDAAR